MNKELKGKLYIRLDYSDIKDRLISLLDTIKSLHFHHNEYYIKQEGEVLIFRLRKNLYEFIYAIYKIGYIDLAFKFLEEQYATNNYSSDLNKLKYALEHDGIYKIKNVHNSYINNSNVLQYIQMLKDNNYLINDEYSNSIKYLEDNINNKNSYTFEFNNSSTYLIIVNKKTKHEIKINFVPFSVINSRGYMPAKTIYEDLERIYSNGCRYINELTIRWYKKYDNICEEVANLIKFNYSKITINKLVINIELLFIHARNITDYLTIDDLMNEKIIINNGNIIQMNILVTNRIRKNEVDKAFFIAEVYIKKVDTNFAKSFAKILNKFNIAIPNSIF